MIGRRKVLKTISYDDFKKRIRKNAKKGEYKSMPVTVPIKAKPDSITVKKGPEKIDAHEPVVPTEVAAAPILKADSLIILSEVLFETNRYKLKGEHFSALDSLGKFS